MYQKALKKWHLRHVDERKSWAAFSKFMVEQYEHLLKLGTAITMGQEGYGTAFHATTATDGDDSLAASIVDYVERTSAAESKVSDLKNRLGMLKIGAGQPANMAM